MKLSDQDYRYLKLVASYALHVFIGVVALIGLIESASAGVHLVSVGNSERVFRGRAVNQNDILKMKDMGIDTVLIFKNETKNEVQGERKLLEKNNFADQNIIEIPFLWKDIRDFKLSCQQTLQALSTLKAVNESADSKVLFHCTVGEDRTGLLAGLFRQLLTGESSKIVFRDEMCARGYADGNPKKPKNVSQEVHAGLTPLFAQLSSKISSGELTFDNIDDLSICDQFDRTWVVTAEIGGYRCK